MHFFLLDENFKIIILLYVNAELERAKEEEGKLVSSTTTVVVVQVAEVYLELRPIGNASGLSIYVLRT